MTPAAPSTIRCRVAAPLAVSVRSMTSSTYLFRSWVTAVPAGRLAGDITLSNMDPMVHHGRRAVDLLGDRARFGRRAARSSQRRPRVRDDMAAGNDGRTHPPGAGWGR